MAAIDAKRFRATLADDEERVAYARALNPGPVPDRCERELAEADEAFDALP